MQNLLIASQRQDVFDQLYGGSLATRITLTAVSHLGQFVDMGRRFPYHGGFP
jgi:hypothetical protein